MLEVLGSEYVIDHIVAEYTHQSEEKLYRIYVCDMLKCLAEFTGAEVNRRYSDLINPKKEPEQTGDEVALEVIEKLGLKVKTHGGLDETEGDSVA